MRSKNPFDHQGISGQYKRGVTVQDAAGTNEYQDLQIRWGHKFSDKLAMKLNFGYLIGTDWIANSETPDFFLVYTANFDSNDFIYCVANCFSFCSITFCTARTGSCSIKKLWAVWL